MVPVVVYSVTRTKDADERNMSFTLVLKSKSDNRILPMIIGLPEAESIIVELKKDMSGDSRPLAHDLIKSSLDLLDTNITKVLITELKGETFHAELTLENEKDMFTLDSRPSDAIALALRFQAPIFISAKLMDTISYRIEEDFEKNVEEKSRLDILKDKLDNAVKNELYEDAARIRDEINKIEEKG